MLESRNSRKETDTAESGTIIVSNVENAVDVCGKGLALPIMESPLAQKSKTGIDVGSTSVMVEITSRVK